MPKLVEMKENDNLNNKKPIKTKLLSKSQNLKSPNF